MSKSKLSADHKDRLKRRRRRDELEMSKKKSDFKKKLEEFYREREDDRQNYLREKNEADKIADFIKPKVSELGWQKAEEEAVSVFGEEKLESAKNWISNLKNKNIN